MSLCSLLHFTSAGKSQADVTERFVILSVPLGSAHLTYCLKLGPTDFYKLLLFFREPDPSSLTFSSFQMNVKHLRQERDEAALTKAEVTLQDNATPKNQLSANNT